MQQSAVAPARPLARLRDHKAPLAVGAVVRVATKVRYGLVAVFLPMLHARAASRRSPELRTIAAVYAIAAVCALGVLAAGTSVVACAVRGVGAIVRAQRHRPKTHGHGHGQHNARTRRALSFVSSWGDATHQFFTALWCCLIRRVSVFPTTSRRWLRNVRPF